MEYDVKNLDLAPGGRRRIDWANEEMSVLQGVMSALQRIGHSQDCVSGQRCT